MQTSQVSNAANVLTTTAVSNKQPDGNTSSEPFGKVLSREVSQRNGANDTPKNKGAANAAPGQQPAKTASKSPEARSAKEGKPADKAKPVDEGTDTTSALPNEMLALVANLAEINTSSAQAVDVPTRQPAEAASDAQTAAVTAAASISTVASQADTHLSETAQLTTAVPTADTLSKSPALQTTEIIGKSDGITAQLKQAEVASKAELPVATSLDTTAKIDELNAQAAAQHPSANTRDFAASMTESLNGVTGNAHPVQQAALNALQQQSPNAEKLTPRVGTPAWDQALGQKVVWMVAGEHQSASLTLNPPDLGPLQVVLNVSNSQANATFIAAQPEVRQALEAALPKLRDMLGEAGIQLGQASVNSGTPNQQGGFDQQASQASRGHSHFGNHDTTGTDAQVRVSRVQPASSGLGLVDTFV